MAEGRFVAYYRVSTARQGKSGLGLEAQQAAVRAFLNGGNWSLVAEFTEVETGKRADRPVLAQALATCRVHGAALVIAKLDRLARNAGFLLSLRDAGVEFVACDLPTANRLTVGVMAVVAEEEARAISERTKAALVAAKARGVKLGGDRGNIREVQARGAEAGHKAQTARAVARASDLAGLIHEIQASGTTSLRGIAAALNGRGVPTARGGEWKAETVRLLIARLSSAALS
ncbi:recombinase family protein [Azospirillum argentinense]